MTHSTSHQERFGQVRAILQESAQEGGPWREALVALLKAQYAHDPARYQHEWLPYLEGFSHLWVEPLHTIHSAEELEHAATVMPFATFAARFDIFTRDALLETVTSPDARQLRALHYYGSHPNSQSLGDRLEADPPHTLELVEALASSTSLDGLTSLTIASSLLGDASCERLAQAPHLAGLTRLELRHNLIGAQGIRALTRSPLMRDVAALDLSGNRFGLDGFAELSRASQLASLRELDVSGVRLGRDAAKFFENSSLFDNLHRLELSLTWLGDDGARAIAGAPWASALHTLCLSTCDLTSGAAMALANAPQLAQLQILDLRRNDINDKGARALASSPYLSQLHTLVLTENPIGARGADALRASSKLSEAARDKLSLMFGERHHDEGVRLLREERFGEALDHYEALASTLGRASWMRQYDQLQMSNAAFALASQALYGVPPGAPRPAGDPAPEALAETSRLIDASAERLERGQLDDFTWRNLNHRSMVASWRKQHELALEIALTVIQYDHSAHSLSSAASCANNCGQLELAESYARQSRDVMPNYWHPHLVLAEVALKRGEPREAVYAHLERVATLWPQGQEELYNSSDLSELRGEERFETLFGP